MIDLAKKILMGADVIDARTAFDPEIRKQYLNASEADSCIRMQWYSAHQPELGTPQQWGFARRGKHGEKYMVERLRAANVPLLFAGDDQVTFYDDEVGISATPDGVVIMDDTKGLVGVELKTIDPRTNIRNLPKKQHVVQLQLGMALMEGDEDLPEGYTFEGGVIVYMDASNFDVIHTFPVDYESGILEKYAGRAKKKLGARNVERLDREGKRNGGKECMHCPFKDACLGAAAADIKPSGTVPKKANKGYTLHFAASTYVDLKDKEKAIKNEISNIAEEIKIELKKRKTNKAIVDDIKIDLQQVAGRTTLDRTAVAAAGIDLSPYETTGSPSERLVVERV